MISLKIKLLVSSGVPQWSVLGSILWNVLNVGVLELPLLEGATTIAFADGLALIVDAYYARDLVFKTNGSIERIVEHKLQAVSNKTEAATLMDPYR